MSCCISLLLEHKQAFSRRPDSGSPPTGPAPSRPMSPQAPFGHFDVLLDQFAADKAEIKWFQAGLPPCTLLPAAACCDGSAALPRSPATLCCDEPQCERPCPALTPSVAPHSSAEPGVELEGTKPAPSCNLPPLYSAQAAAVGDGSVTGH